MPHFQMRQVYGCACNSLLDGVMVEFLNETKPNIFQKHSAHDRFSLGSEEFKMIKETGKSAPPIIEEVVPTLASLHIPTAVGVPFGDVDTKLYAVGLNAVNGGLKVFVERYPRMLEGDYIEVFWSGSTTPAVYTTVDEYNLNTRVGLNIPESEIQSGRLAPYYRLTAASSTEATSPSRNIWVKLDIPGGTNPEPAKQENRNLAAPIVPPDVAQSGVNKARAQSGVEITIQPYPNMAEYDRIEFWWGGQRIWVLVQPDDVGHPVRFTVSEKTILTAGDGEIVLHYQLIDAALNFSDGWSLSTKIKVTASSTLLAAPLVDGAIDGVVDLTALAGRDVNVQILALSSPFAKGDVIELLWAGRGADGGEVNYSASLLLQNVPQVPHFLIPYAKVAAIAQGVAIVSYVLRKPDGTELPSLRTQVSIKGQALSLAAPVVIQENSGRLAYDLSSATVRIAPYASMAQGNEVTLIWAGQRSDGQPTYYSSSVILTQNAVGRDVLFEVPGMEIAALTGGAVDVYYQVKATLVTEVPAQQSAHLKLQVTGNVVLLPTPTVPSAEGDRLAPALSYADVLVPAYPGINIGDDVQLLWIGDLTGLYTDRQTVETRTQEIFGVSLRVYGENIIGNLDHYITVSYTVMRNGSQFGRSASLRLRVGAAQVMLPAPRVDEAQGNILITADVPTSGASVRISAAARLIAGDSGTLHWRGQTAAGLTDIPFTVSQTDQDVVVKVPQAVVAANNGTTITVDYTINRAGGPLTSQSASYEVRASSKTGRLIVMGARSRTGRDRKMRDVPHLLGQSWLTALDAHAHQPMEALWRYLSQGNNEAIAGSRFLDTRPTEVLEVQALGDRVQIRPRNLTGSGQIAYDGYLTQGAFAAQRDNGSLVVWGHQNSGGSFPLNSAIPGLTDITDVIPNDRAFAALRRTGQVVVWGEAGNGGSFPDSSIIAGLTDIVQVVPTRFAFAARRENGAVIAWGHPTLGGNIPANSGISSLTDIVDIVANGHAFAALRKTGQVVAWGEAINGGSIPADSGISSLTDIVQVVSSSRAFAALRKSGQAVAWGNSASGGNIPANSGVSSLTDITQIVGGASAFAALRSNGSVVAWGNPETNGNIPPNSGISGLTDINKVVSNWQTFVALRDTGNIVAWGPYEYGGIIPASISSLSDIVEVLPSYYAFAARRKNGQVVAWGDPNNGGSFPNGSVIPSLTDVVQVVASIYAFAALRANGTVVAWGNAGGGGLIPTNIAQQLTDIRAIYSNFNAFVALTADNRVISWGYEGSGGNNAAIPSSLQGSISYEVKSGT